MGFPFFNPPNIQKVNTIEQGNFFVPTEGVEPESVYEEQSPNAAKRKKVLKIALTVLCAGVLGVLVFFWLRDYILYGIY